MHECIQFREKAKYSRIAVRIPADLERACRHLAHNEGWGLGDLYRSLIVLGASGSFLMLRSRKSREFSSIGSFEQHDSTTRPQLRKGKEFPHTKPCIAVGKTNDTE